SPQYPPEVHPRVGPKGLVLGRDDALLHRVAHLPEAEDGAVLVAQLCHHRLAVGEVDRRRLGKLQLLRRRYGVEVVAAKGEAGAREHHEPQHGRHPPGPAPSSTRLRWVPRGRPRSPVAAPAVTGGTNLYTGARMVADHLIIGPTVKS